MSAQNIDQIVNALRSTDRVGLTDEQLEGMYPGITAQVRGVPLEPALDLIARRSQTNGWAEERELAEAVGVDRSDLCELQALVVRLSVHPAIRAVPQYNEPTRYMLRG